MPIICDTPEKIEAFQLLALKGALSLEVKGLTRHGRSAYSIIKERFKLKGNKQKVLNQYIDILQKRGILV